MRWSSASLIAGVLAALVGYLAIAVELLGMPPGAPTALYPFVLTALFVAPAVALVGLAFGISGLVTRDGLRARVAVIVCLIAALAPLWWLIAVAQKARMD